MTCRALAVAVMIGLAASATLAADLPGDPAAGRKMAIETCAACHLVAERPTSIGNSLAPAFSAIAGDPATTALALRVFLQTPHAAMPNLALSPAESDDMISYILSLRQR